MGTCAPRDQSVVPVNRMCRLSDKPKTVRLSTIGIAGPCEAFYESAPMDVNADGIARLTALAVTRVMGMPPTHLSTPRDYVTCVCKLFADAAVVAIATRLPSFC